MENTSQPMDVNIVDLGDESSVSPTLGIGGSETAGRSTPRPMVSPTNTDPESGAYKKKQWAKTSKVWNDFESIVARGIKKSQYMWCKRLFAVTKSSITTTINRHLSKCVKYMEQNNKKQQTLSLDPSDTEA